MDYDNLIGQKLDFAKEFLESKGLSNIKIVNNSVYNNDNFTKVVTKVEVHDDEIILVCGEFNLNFKENYVFQKKD